MARNETLEYFYHHAKAELISFDVARLCIMVNEVTGNNQGALCSPERNVFFSVFKTL